jgi:hypothetical protein
MRRFLSVLGLLTLAVAPLAAQQATCTTTCGLHIEHRFLGDRLIDANGQRVGTRMLTPKIVQSAVQGVPLAEAWADVHARADRKARIWGGIAALATVGLLFAEGNDMYTWDRSDQQAMIWGSAITGFVFGSVAQRQQRISDGARGAALATFNAARAPR